MPTLAYPLLYCLTCCKVLLTSWVTMSSTSKRFLLSSKAHFATIFNGPSAGRFARWSTGNSRNTSSFKALRNTSKTCNQRTVHPLLESSTRLRGAYWFSKIVSCDSCGTTLPFSLARWRVNVTCLFMAPQYQFNDCNVLQPSPAILHIPFAAFLCQNLQCVYLYCIPLSKLLSYQIRS